MNELQFKPNEIFLNKYEISSLIGTGAFGGVYKARDIKLDRTVAIKIIRSQQTSLDSFASEIEAVKRLEHPNIARLYDFDLIKGGTPCLIMEFVDGRELGDVLSAEGPFTLERIADVGLQVIDALVETHKLGIVHCDLKPENIMLTSMGARTDVVKLIDFGVASIVTQLHQDTKKDRALVGTPQYMAPEQIRRENIGPWTDIYAIGLILIELYTGTIVFDDDDPREVLKKQLYTQVPIPPEVARTELGPIIEHAVAKDPAVRYQSTLEFYNDLKTAIDNIKAEGHAKYKRTRINSRSFRERAFPSIFEDVADATNRPDAFGRINIAYDGRRDASRSDLPALNRNNLNRHNSGEAFMPTIFSPRDDIDNNQTIIANKRSSSNPNRYGSDPTRYGSDPNSVGLPSLGERVSRVDSAPTGCSVPLISKVPKSTHDVTSSVNDVVAYESHPRLSPVSGHSSYNNLGTVGHSSYNNLGTVGRDSHPSLNTVGRRDSHPSLNSLDNAVADFGSLNESIDRLEKPDLTDRKDSKPSQPEIERSQERKDSYRRLEAVKLDSKRISEDNVGRAQLQSTQMTVVNSSPRLQPIAPVKYESKKKSFPKSMVGLMVVVLCILIAIAAYWAINSLGDRATGQVNNPEANNEPSSTAQLPGIRRATVLAVGKQMAEVAYSSAVRSAMFDPKEIKSYDVIGTPLTASIYLDECRVCNSTPCTVHTYGDPANIEIEIRSESPFRREAQSRKMRLSEHTDPSKPIMLNVPD